MLPMMLQFIIVMIASAINDRLQRKLDQIEEERCILREQLDAVTGGKKLSFTTEQRRRLPPSPPKVGAWAVLHEIRSDWAQLMTSAYLLWAGPGPWSVDAILRRRLDQR